MKKSYKMKEHLKKLSYTAATVVLTVSVIVSMITYMYRFSEQESFEMLHLETQQIKNNINHQMFSDREILRTMASFASKLYSGGEDYGLIFNSFKETGMFENIGILTPDNRFITKLGSLNLEGKVSFEEEKERGEYISGRVKDITNDSREVVRSAVPVKTEDGTVIAVIYGVINLEKLEERYRAEAEAADAQLYVLEGGNGNYIIDTRHNKLGNVTGLSSSRYKKGFSYEKMIDDLTAGVPGYAAFMSQNGEGYLYAHYAPMEFADWQIMLTQSEELVFAGAKATGQYLTLIAGIIILIMLAYITLILASERKAATMNLCASEIRKNLLEVNRSIDKIQDALKSITDFAKSRSAFIIDTYNDDYNYIAPSQKHKLLMGEERSYFNTKLLTYAAKHRTEHGAALYLSEIVTGRKLQSKMPDLYEFARAHDIKRVCYAVVITNNSNTYVLGVINPKAGYVSELLKEIAICFSMAIYNKKHLTKTEAMALTDSLTGTSGM